jgi:hypothetical protein
VLEHESEKTDDVNTRVYVEEGKKSVFVAALDWPGWCRRGAYEEAAMDAFLNYADRYALVAGALFTNEPIEVVGRIPGTSTTDFGALDARGPWDAEPLAGDELQRFVDLLSASWRYFDNVVATSSVQLEKGPRCGGRDRDQVADHARETDRRLASKLGRRIAPRTPWDEQRELIVATLLEGSPDATWPPRYAIRRGAWHILDHAWEIEDKQV